MIVNIIGDENKPAMIVPVFLVFARFGHFWVILAIFGVSGYLWGFVGDLGVLGALVTYKPGGLNLKGLRGV